jgi:hypothetical protein
MGVWLRLIGGLQLRFGHGVVRARARFDATQETPMASSETTPVTSHDRPDLNPAAAYPPSRPNARWLLMFVVVVLFGATIMNWSKLSTFGPILQIEHAMGL